VTNNTVLTVNQDLTWRRTKKLTLEGYEFVTYRPVTPNIFGMFLRWTFRNWEGVVETGWSWFGIGTGGGHLRLRRGTFGFQK
jgi:hypothetical protein